MEPWIIWLIVAIALLIVEILTQYMWALCLSIGAIAGLVCGLCGLAWPWQVTVMAIVSIVACSTLLPRFRRWHARTPTSRTGAEAMLGQRTVLTEPIYPDQPGRARLDGSSWQVVAPGITEPIPSGTEVVVTGIDSIILQVKPINN